MKLMITISVTCLSFFTLACCNLVRFENTSGVHKSQKAKNIQNEPVGPVLPFVPLLIVVDGKADQN